MWIAVSLVLVGGPETLMPTFLMEKLDKVQQALEQEEKWLVEARKEVEARAARTCRDEDEHWSLGRASQKTVKKGPISDLLYDRV